MAEIDIMKIPLIKSIAALCFASVGLFPPFLFLFDIDQKLFEHLDIIKLIILCGGFGLIFLTSSVICIYLLVSSLNKTVSDRILQNIPLGTTGIASLSYFILALIRIFWDCSIKWSIILLYSGILCLSLFLVIGIKYEIKHSKKNL